MLDQSAPYGEVWGMPGVKYEQNGQYYRADFSPLDAAKEPAPAPVAERDDLDNKPNRVLQAMVEQYGGKWRNREHALAYLREGRE